MKHILSRRVLCVVLCIIIVISLSACANSDTLVGHWSMYQNDCQVEFRADGTCEFTYPLHELKPMTYFYKYENKSIFVRESEDEEWALKYEVTSLSSKKLVCIAVINGKEVVFNKQDSQG